MEEENSNTTSSDGQREQTNHGGGGAGGGGGDYCNAERQFLGRPDQLYVGVVPESRNGSPFNRSEGGRRGRDTIANVFLHQQLEGEEMNHLRRRVDYLNQRTSSSACAASDDRHVTDLPANIAANQLITSAHVNDYQGLGYVTLFVFSSGRIDMEDSGFYSNNVSNQDIMNTFSHRGTNH